MANSAAILFFGPPGSGKGTQARLLADCLRIPHISTGDILREHVEARDALGLEAGAIMKAGKLVPDGLVNRIVEERISRPDCASGFILDGYPRTLEQAEVSGRMLERRGVCQVVVNLVVDYNIVVARVSARRHCSVCGASYNLVSSPPKNDEICDCDGTPLVIRADDRPGVIWKRLEAYEQQTLPLVTYFRSAASRFIEVDGNGTPAEIARQVCRRVKDESKAESIA